MGGITVMLDERLVRGAGWQSLLGGVMTTALQQSAAATAGRRRGRVRAPQSPRSFGAPLPLWNVRGTLRGARQRATPCMTRARRVRGRDAWHTRMFSRSNGQGASNPNVMSSAKV